MSSTTYDDSILKEKSILQLFNENFEKPVVIIGLLGAILLISYQCLGRYVFLKFFPGMAIPVWTEELSRYLFIWSTYGAIPLTIRLRNNIRIDVIYDKLSGPIQGMTWILVDLAFITLSSVILYTSIGYLDMQLNYKMLTPALRIPFYIPYLILPVGFGLMMVRLLQDIIEQVKESGFKYSIIGFILFVAIVTPVFFLENLSVLALLFGYFVVFMVIGVPIAICLGLAALATIVGAETLPIDYVAQIPFTSIDSLPIMAIPFFIAAGVFMGAGGLSKRLLALADYLLGSLPGGIALASIAASMFFAAISGSGPATVAAIGMLTIPAMIERGYNKFFAGAVVAAAGAIGVMIPPSNPFVVYGITAQASIGKLFMGGIVPGVLTGLALMVFTYFHSKKNGWKGIEQEKSFRLLVKVIWDAKWALLVPVIVLGGIYGGLMTPTEAAAVAALYGAIAGVSIYKELTLRDFLKSVIDAGSSSAAIIMLIAMATLFGNIMAIESMPEKIANIILSITEEKMMILLMINIFLLFVGTFMEALAAIVILTPVLLPVVVKLGVDPVHFGIIMVVNLAIGFVTPPVGVNLFVASGVARAKIADLSIAILPLLALMITVLLMITYFPELPMLFVPD